jgi:hypothetical protein
MYDVSERLHPAIRGNRPALGKIRNGGEVEIAADETAKDRPSGEVRRYRGREAGVRWPRISRCTRPIGSNRGLSAAGML